MYKKTFHKLVFTTLACVCPLLLFGCGCEYPEDGALVEFKLRDANGSSVWDVNTVIHSKEGKELVTLAPAMETLTLYMPKKSDVKWDASAHLDDLEKGVEVSLKRGDEILQSFFLSLSSFSGGYNFPSFFELPGGHHSGYLYRAPYYSYGYSKQLLLPSEYKSSVSGLPRNESDKKSLKIKSHSVGVIPVNDGSIVFHVRMLKSDRDSEAKTGLAIYTNNEEIIRASLLLNPGLIRFFEFDDQFYRIENVKAEYNETGNKRSYYLDSNSYVVVEISRASKEDFFVSYRPKQVRNSFPMAKPLEGTEVPKEVLKVVSTLRKESEAFPKVAQNLGREFEVSHVTGEVLGRLVNNLGRNQKEAFISRIDTTHYSTDFYKIINYGKEEFIAFAKVDTGEVVFLLRK